MQPDLFSITMPQKVRQSGRALHGSLAVTCTDNQQLHATLICAFIHGVLCVCRWCR